MSNVAIVTDSNSGITQAESKKLGITVIPMPFTIDGESYLEDINLTQEEFYKKLSEDSAIFTSQPAAGDIIDLWDELLKDHDGVVHIPMSSTLSASCQTAMFLSADYDGKVQIVDNQRISVPMKQSARDAKTLADAGWDALRIKEYLEKVKYETSIYLMVDTLKYLKKGGRISPAAAAIGTLMNIKPLLQIQNGKLDTFSKAIGVTQACKIMIDCIRHDFETRFADCADPEHIWLQMAYTYDIKAAMDFKSEAEAAFPEYTIEMNPLSLSVSCHTGPGVLGIGCTRKLDCL